MCCPLVFEFSVGIGGFVIGLGPLLISFFFSFYYHLKNNRDTRNQNGFYIVNLNFGAMFKYTQGNQM